MAEHESIVRKSSVHPLKIKSLMHFLKLLLHHNESEYIYNNRIREIGGMQNTEPL